MCKWHPVLSGEEAAAAKRTAREVAEEIAHFYLDSEPAAACHAWEWADLALMFAYAARVLGESRFEELAARCRDLAIDNAAAAANRLHLYGGIVGVAWAENQVGRLLAPEPSSPEEADEQFEELDDAILGSLVSPSAFRDYDLIGGRVGLAVYLLERLPSARAREGLVRIIDKLESTAERVNDGARWLTPPEWIPEPQRSECPDGYYNLGLAHGIPGILVVLAEMHAASIAPERTRELVAGGVSFVLANRRSDRMGGGVVPGWIAASSDEPRSSAPAVRWCYYDLGVGMALLRVGRLMREPSWIEAALRLLERCASVENPAARVQDAALCHGAFGAAHLFNRAHQALGSPVLRDAARRWYRVGQNMRQPGWKLGGFPAFHPYKANGEANANPWRETADFLDGSTGICLSLLAAVSDLEPSWDHRLLVTM